MKIAIQNVRLEQVFPAADNKYRVVVDALVDGRRKSYAYREDADAAMEIITRQKDKAIMSDIRKREKENG